MVHGVIALEYLVPEFGPYRRRLRVQKLRTVKFQEGHHDLEIHTGAISVYPRLVRVDCRDTKAGEQTATGIAELDSILAGGLERGTSTLVMGPAGSGKSSLATRLAWTALQRGEKVALYLFDERLATMLSVPAASKWTCAPTSRAEARLSAKWIRSSFHLASSPPWCAAKSKPALAR